VVVSAYPIVSLALAGLRRRARLPWPCATLVTDFHPHPAWLHPDLGANLVVGEPGPTQWPISPPIAAIRPDAEARQRVRAELGIPTAARVALIVGGAWGVGNLHGAARAVATEPNVHAIIVTGRNQRLYQVLEHDVELGDATILGFTERMPELMAASDVLIQNAGGLTCLEAFGTGLPVVMFEPLPGHGEDNSRRMRHAGLVAAARNAADLRATVGSSEFWETLAPAQSQRARALFDRQSAGMATTRLTTKTVTQPGHARRLAPTIAASLTLGAWFIAENPPPGYDATPRQPQASHLKPARPAETGTIRGRSSP
jgi:UDP-N-acetylglucosamine:LPS N-acetylglucosamine transferase